MYRDRHDAGRALAQLLTEVASADALVLALPRGGVPVAEEICAALGAPLGLLPVRKIGLPGQSELAVGAIARHIEEARVLNEDIVAATGLGPDEIERLTRRAREELDARLAAFPDKPRDPAGKTAILVDDGLATGATMRAAVAVMRLEHAGEVIVALPVGAPDSVAEIGRTVEHMICPFQPRPFRSVGEHYLHFGQVDDGDVRRILTRFGQN
jgi:putative phosphoribosyl transferase